MTKEVKIIMSLVTIRECGRKAFVQDMLPKTTKSSSLHTVMKETIRRIGYDPINAKSADIEKACGEAFDEKAEKMLPFEAESERSRLVYLIERWVQWEQQNKDWKLLAHDLKETVRFAGEDRVVGIDALVQRSDHIEAIRFRYSSPYLTYQGKAISSQPEKNPELLLLFLAAEAVAAKLGVSVGRAMPLYASFFHMKSKEDTAKHLASNYNNRLGYNIISHSFLPNERVDLENEFTAMKASPAEEACDEKSCRECPCDDLCHAEFVPHKLEEQPDVELRKINEIRLTPDQQRFVNYDDGVVRVNAVAGAGKTTVVSLRTLALIEEGAKPANILMMTFTDKAKHEMKQRLRSYAEGDALARKKIPVDDVVVETFNSWGQSIVEQYHDKLGFTNPPTLVDDVAKKDIIVDLLDRHKNLPFDYRNPFLNTPVAQGAVTVMVSIIDALKAYHAETKEDVRQAAPKYATGDALAQELLEMYEEYNARLIQLNMLDFEDQLRLLLKLKDLGIFAQMPYEHVVIDEFQDSNRNQIDIIVELFRNAPNVKSLAVVGDELQAIYGFRNATPENLVTFDQYFAKMDDIPLADNFRSETPIIKLANHIISCTARIPKQILCHSTQSGIPPAVMNIESVKDEQNLYTRQIKKLLRNQVAPSDIAVLCRNRSELIQFQKAFDEAGIPTVLRVPKVVGDEPYVKAIIALAAFLQDNLDLLDFALYAKSLGQDPFDVPALQASAQAVHDLIAACDSEEAKIATFLQLVHHCTDDYVAASFVESLLNRHFHTLRAYLDYCVKYRLYCTKDTISTSREEADCVTLMTVHSAKGLEWDTVLLSMRGFRYSAEEERVLYVAVTRAKKRLLITYTEKQRPFLNLICA